MDIPDFRQKANVKLICDGSVAGTRVVFIHQDGTEEPIVPVAAAKWSLSVLEGSLVPMLELKIEMAAAELVQPAELVDFIGIQNRKELFQDDQG